MALTRNQRRKLSRERSLAKAVRIAKATELAELNVRKDIIRTNMSSPIPSKYSDGRGLYRSCLDGMKGQSHRAYVCQNEARPRRLWSVDDSGRTR